MEWHRGRGRGRSEAAWGWWEARACGCLWFYTHEFGQLDACLCLQYLALVVPLAPPPPSQRSPVLALHGDPVVARGLVGRQQHIVPVRRAAKYSEKAGSGNTEERAAHFTTTHISDKASNQCALSHHAPAVKVLLSNSVTLFGAN